MSRVLLLFAPKFREFGVDVARELVDRGFADKIDGVCTGGTSTVEVVRAGLGEIIGELIDIESEEPHWAGDNASGEELAAIDAALAPGAVGRIITSDRRVGSGFVTGGRTRPSVIKSYALKEPARFPPSYANRLVRRLDDLIVRTKPRCIFLYAHAGAPSAALVEIAAAKGLPVYRIAPARSGRRFIIDDDPTGSLRALRFFYAPLDLIADRDRRAADEELQQFREQPEAPEYMSYNAAAQRGQLSRLSARAMLTIAVKLPRWLWRRDTKELVAIQRSCFNAMNAFRRAFASNRYFSAAPPKDRRLVYFPLHVDPEASTMVAAPYHTNQFAVVEALSKALPADAVLMVKEHRPMKGLRPRGFYKAIASLPRVVLLPPETGSMWCIQKSTLTVVITGTAAWEAILLGKPALVIGSSPYLQIGEGIMHEPCLAKLPEAIAEALEMPPASDRALIEFLAALHAASFEMRTSVLWGEYLRHDDEERTAAVHAVASGIIRLHALSTAASSGSEGE